MDNEEDIGEVIFHSWKNHPVTKNLLRFIDREITYIQSCMLSEEVVLAPTGKLVYARLVGMRNMCNRIKDIELLDLNLGEIDNGNEKNT